MSFDYDWKIDPDGTLAPVSCYAVAFEVVAGLRRCGGADD